MMGIAHITALKPQVGRPFLNGQDPRRNAGGRPRGLASLAREAVGDGHGLVAFFLAVLRGDAEALGERRITMRDRLQAAEWLADRGFGKAPIVVEIPEEQPPEDDSAWQITEAQMDELSGETRGKLLDVIQLVREERQRLRMAVVEARVRASLPKTDGEGPEQE
jgi:hypothetical protein